MTLSALLRVYSVVYNGADAMIYKAQHNLLAAVLIRSELRKN